MQIYDYKYSQWYVSPEWDFNAMSQLSVYHTENYDVVMMPSVSQLAASGQLRGLS